MIWGPVMSCGDALGGGNIMVHGKGGGRRPWLCPFLMGSKQAADQRWSGARQARRRTRPHHAGGQQRRCSSAQRDGITARLSCDATALCCPRREPGWWTLDGARARVASCPHVPQRSADRVARADWPRPASRPFAGAARPDGRRTTAAHSHDARRIFINRPRPPSPTPAPASRAISPMPCDARMCIVTVVLRRAGSPTAPVVSSPACPSPRPALLGDEY